MIVTHLGREFVPNGWDNYVLLTMSPQELRECADTKVGTQHYADEWVRNWHEQQVIRQGLVCTSACAMPHPSRPGTFIVLAEVRATS